MKGETAKIISGKVAQIKRYVGQNLISLLCLLAMCVILVFVGAMNFSDMSFDWTRVSTIDFWINYGLLMGLAIIMFTLAIVYGKSKQKKSEDITDLKEMLSIQRNYLDDHCLSSKFDVHLESLNKQRKVEDYRERLRFTSVFMPTRKLKEHYLRAAEEITLENIGNVRYKLKKPYTRDLVFCGVPTKKEGSLKINYTGREGFVGALLPALMWSLLFQCVLLCMVFSEKTSTLDTFIKLLAQMWVMVSFAVKGVSYGVYSVSDVYKSVLENRMGMVMTFLAVNGINIVIKGNEYYKYKAVEQPGAQNVVEIPGLQNVAVERPEVKNG